MRQARVASKSGNILLIALGSNDESPLGAPDRTVAWALDRLSQRFDGGRASRLYRSAAFPPGNGPDYVNAAFAGTSAAPAGEILAMLHGLEAEAGRHRARRWGARSLDLDLIALGQEVRPDAAAHAAWRALPLAEQARQTPDQLILPHPRMQDRSFVLAPLAELAPDWVHPLLGRSVRQMLEDLPQADRDALDPIGP